MDGEMKNVGALQPLCNLTINFINGAMWGLGMFDKFWSYGQEVSHRNFFLNLLYGVGLPLKFQRSLYQSTCTNLLKSQSISLVSDS
jgi:hypothetical protein